LSRSGGIRCSVVAGLRDSDAHDPETPPWCSPVGWLTGTGGSSARRDYVGMPSVEAGGTVVGGVGYIPVSNEASPASGRKVM
jgi:hypothetical protein